MHLVIVGDDSIDAQARSYAEYRLFAALSRRVDTRQVRSASLRLRQEETKGPATGITCTVTVELHDGDVVGFKTSAGHPYAAINRAVERFEAAAWPARDIRASADVEAFS